MAAGSESMLSVEVWRGAAEGRFQTFQVPRRAHQTILDVVTEIQRDQDATCPIASPAGSACAAPAPWW